MPRKPGDPHPGNFPWTKELDDKLIELWNTGAVVSDIAAVFGCAHSTTTRRAKFLKLPNKLSTPPWTKKTEDILRQMWTDGASCSVIGAVIGYSRNAVIGKRARLKLPARAPTPVRGNGERIPRKRSNPTKRPISPDGKPLPPRPVVQTSDIITVKREDELNPGVALVDLRQGDCHDVLRENPYRYCGKKCDEGKSFCPAHYGIYYIPVTIRKRDRNQKYYW